MSTLTREVRSAPLSAVTVRAAKDQDAIGFRGHAAVFDSRTWIGPPRWGFFEEIAPNAFRDVLDDDAAFLVNHDPNLVLARNPTTMRLSEDSTGLLVDADLARTSYGEDLAISLERGDVSKMSFAFEVADEEWLETEDGSNEVRRILKIRRLWDVASVTYPAYEDADGGLRSRGVDILAAHRGVDPARVRSRLATLTSDPGGHWTDLLPQRDAVPAGGPSALLLTRHAALAKLHRLPA